MSSILAALNKAKEQKQQEQIELASKVQNPENSYWKYKNGINGKDGWFIGDEGFKSSLQIIGLDDKLIDDWLTYPVTDREDILDYYD